MLSLTRSLKMETATKNNYKTLLDEMYKNVKMGADSIVNVMSSVEDKALREELTAQLERYGEYAHKIEDILYSDGSSPKEENMITKISSKLGIKFNTMMDSTSTHIAQMIIEGATMGVTNMTRLLREYENTSCPEKILSLARDIIEYEEATIETMKRFL